MVPSVIVIILVLIPAITATIGVVREVETGSIANFRSTPISKFEFLMGKQVPYVVVGMLAFILLVLMAFVVFRVTIKGSFGALALGALLYVFSTCGFGQLISTFTRTQVAAVFATTVIAIIPTVNFSGLLVPVSSLTGQGRVIGLMFPMAWFQPLPAIRFGAGFAMNQVDTSLGNKYPEHFTDSSSWEPGLVVEAAVTVPVASRFYFFALLQYRWLQDGTIGPWQGTASTGEVVVFPETDITLSHGFIGAGVGIRF
jgi:ABC-type transport system involved in multi-copper enzyme maturation permease subunit